MRCSIIGPASSTRMRSTSLRRYPDSSIKTRFVSAVSIVCTDVDDGPTIVGLKLMSLAACSDDEIFIGEDTLSVSDGSKLGTEAFVSSFELAVTVDA